MTTPLRTTDPIEQIIERGFIAACLPYETEREHHPGREPLDFYLPTLGVYVEVKQFHTPRIEAQMARAKNVIAIQGEAAARAFVRMLQGQKEGQS